ncbi:tetratricopeptide repeat protein [Planomonospora sp. ID67723]|uniref:tetratricopeptide repeat protein n=1 Tax=Planomonospora sp. ID67723 TaxID=2738134 RepID=UPI0018C3C90F|nr:tetratricopeptide repeat protein [Planomonospora sp. ID67723]MBG0831188.1 tetratricopeptide repeat protein [Planomonospora sp. ID67723]
MSRGQLTAEGPDLPPLLTPPVDADRRLRGPYTAGGAIASALAPVARPELVARYDIELRAVAPDLHDLVPSRRQSIAAHLPPAERILVHAPRRTLRLANGLAEFVREHLADTGPRTLVVENASEADPTDRELLQVLRRRIGPELLTLVVDEQTVPEPELDPAEHDKRADELERQGTVGARLGAIPYHRERGTDPRRAVEALRFAVEWCLDTGCHHAVAELGLRALPLVDPETEPDLWWRFLHSTATALGSLRREDEAEALFDRARRESVSPVTHAAAAYSTGMLKVRHHDPARRDPDAALAWVNQAIAISTLLPDRRERAFKLGFDLNGRALIEVRLGRPAKALELVQQAVDLADRELAPDEHPIHRLVLLANRAQLAIMLGRPEDALEDLDRVIAADPGYPDYYIDRGNLLHRLGRLDAAVADYESAMEAGPPFPEPYYNRAEVRFSTGDHSGALADLDHALELDPEFVDALANRAGLLAALGEYGRARADAEAGLALDPDNPYLLCALGQVEMAEGRHAKARAALDRALERAPSLTAAWASRGALAFETGDPAGAVADFTRALEPGADPALLFNRAVALRAAGRPGEAAADLARALELAPDDEDIRRELASLDGGE